VLAAASVQGSEFVSAVVARVLSLDASEVEERLEVLDRVHGLVRLRREQELPDGTLVLRYQFVHVLYQNALYAAMQPTRRATYSAAVAQALMGHYGGQSATIAGELALFLEVAQDWGRAVEFFLVAAQNAARLHAHREAVVLARQGLELLPRLPETPDRARNELRLQVTLSMSLSFTMGYSAPEVAQTFGRARELCQQTFETSELSRILLGLWRVNAARADFRTTRELAEQLFSLAQNRADPVLFQVARYTLEFTMLHLGELDAARSQLEWGLTFHDPQPGRLRADYGPDPNVTLRAVGALTLWLLGYPDQALKRGQEALALARQKSDSVGLAVALYYNASVHQWRREGQATEQLAEALVAHTTEQGFSFWLAEGMALGGWALARQGQWAEGMARIREGITAFRSTGAEIRRPYYLALLAETLGAGGQFEEGLAAVAEALAVAEATGERYCEAELLRLRGELLLRRVTGRGSSSPVSPAAPRPSDPDPSRQGEAEACFRQALAVARRQGAKSLELRAALSLTRLLREPGQQAEGRRLLAELLGWFTEGWDTPDLQEARAFIEELA
jgi:predicted ATPase